MENRPNNHGFEKTSIPWCRERWVLSLGGGGFCRDVTIWPNKLTRSFEFWREVWEKFFKGAKHSPSLFLYPYITTSIPYTTYHLYHLPYSLYTCISWFGCMTRFSRSMVWLCNKCLQVCIRCLPTYELHISLLEVGWERRQCYYS
jgi:hypothetical protein